MSALKIEQLFVNLLDNYVYLIHDTESGLCACVDPGVSEPIVQALDKMGVPLTHIFITHHHFDHIDGVSELKEKYGATVIAHEKDCARIPLVDVMVNDGETFMFGTHPVSVMDVSGHTIGHIVYYFADDKILFCGDTLFAMGCGRLAEGTKTQMWQSLSKIKALPDDVMVYCAHEYTESNGRFALTIEPDNVKLQNRFQDVLALRKDKLPTVPSLLGLEKETNPFLRSDDIELQTAIGMLGQKPEDVFGEIRLRKDNF